MNAELAEFDAMTAAVDAAAVTGGAPTGGSFWEKKMEAELQHKIGEVATPQR